MCEKAEWLFWSGSVTRLNQIYFILFEGDGEKMAVEEALVTVTLTVESWLSFIQQNNWWTSWFLAGRTNSCRTLSNTWMPLALLLRKWLECPLICFYESKSFMCYLSKKKKLHVFLDVLLSLMMSTLACKLRRRICTWVASEHILYTSNTHERVLITFLV